MVRFANYLPGTKDNVFLRLHAAVECGIQAAASAALHHYLSLGPTPSEFTSLLVILSSKLGRQILIYGTFACYTNTNEASGTVCNVPDLRPSYTYLV